MSTVTFHPDQKRGQPTNRAQWVAYENSGPESQLALSVALRFRDAINEGYPQPQANSLAKVSCVAEAVAAGANTPDAIAEALNVHTREGVYYANAAGYLGLIDSAAGDMVTTYELTNLGELFCSGDDSDRGAIMQSLVAQTPGVQILDDGGATALVDYLMETGLNETTAERRACTINAWGRALESASEFKDSAGAELDGTRERASLAAAHAETARRARVQAAQRSAPVMSYCPSCGMQLAMSGECDFC